MKIATIVKTAVSGILFAGFLVSASIASGQEPAVQSNAELAKKAKYTIGQARKIALRQNPGEIERESLEKENGVLFYSFKIREYYDMYVNVKVDAITGKILNGGKEIVIPDIGSSIKKGSVNGFKKFGQGIRSAANLVVRLFPN